MTNNMHHVPPNPARHGSIEFHFDDFGGMPISLLEEIIG
jgi:hypothetical protein